MGVQSTHNGEALGLLTVGKIGKVVGVSPRTVAKWFDAGKLRGFRLNGGDRRIYLDSVVAYLDAIGHTQGAAALRRSRAVAVAVLAGLTGPAADRVGRHLVGAGACAAFVCAASLFEAGQLVSAHSPVAVVLSLTLGRGACKEAGRLLGRQQATPPRRVAVLAEDDADRAGLRGDGFDAVCGADADPDEVLKAITEGT